jgi:FlaA1/EpsC-like NDP-sugar epimerase
MNTNIFTNSTVLITGGTGSWGQELTKQLLELGVCQILIFSRGEIAQVAMQRKFCNSRIEFIIGDIRDFNALHEILHNHKVDFIFHLAALKHVPICENQPLEAIKTNINGTINIIQCAIRYKVKKFIAVSTDKAVDPSNLYGMTKAVEERLVIHANCQTKTTEFICIRGGNVLGSNGSIIPYVIEQIKETNRVKVTDDTMTRFFLTLSKAVKLLLFAAEEGVGGETYVMNMPSFRLIDLITSLIDCYGNQHTKIDLIGIREGEKIHEVLISNHELSRTSYVNDNYFVIYPAICTGRNYGNHIWEHFDFKVAHKITKELSSKDDVKSIEFLENVLIEEGHK